MSKDQDSKTKKEKTKMGTSPIKRKPADSLGSIYQMHIIQQKADSPSRNIRNWTRLGT